MATVEYALGPGDVPELCALYGTYGWWADRDESAVRRALAGTDEVVALREARDGTENGGWDGDLVASARVLTDYTYYAMVFDVIVRPDRRGEGIGRELMAALVAHPALSGVTLSLLAREGLVGFYASCGFRERGPVPRPDGEPEPLRFLTYEREG